MSIKVRIDLQVIVEGWELQAQILLVRLGSFLDALTTK
jgi:hypothetical protein